MDNDRHRLDHDLSDRPWNSEFSSLRTIDCLNFEALRKKARRSLSDVAEEVKVSVRTVRRRLSFLTKNNAFFLLPVPSFDKLVGVLCNFRVYCPNEKKRRIVDKEIESHLTGVTFAKTTAKEYSVFTVLFRSVGEADQCRIWMKDLNGVKAVKT